MQDPVCVWSSDQSLFQGKTLMSQKGWNTNTNTNTPPASSISLSSQASVNYRQNPNNNPNLNHQLQLQNQLPTTSLATSRSPHLGFIPFGFGGGGDSFVNPPSSYSAQQQQAALPSSSPLPRPQMRNEAGMALVFSMGGQVLNIGFEKAVEYLGGFGEQLFARTSVSLESLIHYEDLPSILQMLIGLNHGSSRELVVRMVTDFGRYQWMHLRLSLRAFPATNGPEDCVVANCHRREGPEQALTCEDELRASAFSAHLNFSSEFVFVSPASLHILGIPPSNLLGCQVQDFIPEEDYAFYESRWSEAQSRGSPNVLFNILFRTPTGYFPVIVTFFFPRDQANFACLCTIGLNTYVQPTTVPPAFLAPKQTSLDLPDPLNQGEMTFPELPTLTNPSFDHPLKTISPLMTISGGSSSLSSSSSSIDLLSSHPMNKISPAALPTPPPSLSSSSSTSISTSSSSSSTTSLPLTSGSTLTTVIQMSGKGGKVKAPPRSTAAHQPKQPVRKPSITEFSSSSSSSPSSDNDHNFSVSQATGKADSNLKLILKRPETKRAETGEDGTIRKKKKKKSIYRRSKRTDNQCEYCARTESPEWRRGPSGSNSLCNACGIKYSKKGLPASGFIGRRHSFGPGSSSPGDGSSSLTLDSRRTSSAGLMEGMPENENPEERNHEAPE